MLNIINNTEIQRGTNNYVLAVWKGHSLSRVFLRYSVMKISADGEILADERVGPEFAYSERKEFMEYVKNAQEEFDIKDLYIVDFKLNKNIEALFENIHTYNDAYYAKQDIPAFKQSNYLW